MNASKTKAKTTEAAGAGGGKRVRISETTSPVDADGASTARSVEKHPRAHFASIPLSLQAAVRVSKVLSHANWYIKPLGSCVWREAAQISSCSAEGDEIRERGRDAGWFSVADDGDVVLKWDKVFYEAWHTLRSDGNDAPWSEAYTFAAERVDEPNLLTFTLPNNTTLTTPFLDGAFSPAVFDQLWAEAEPSPFGDMTTHETRVDESVRKGRELLAGKHWTVNANFVKDLTDLWGLHPAEVRVVPYKLNMYQAGGGFAWHADTPEQDLIGTMLVGLCEHDGEKGFQIKHGAREKEWNCVHKRTYSSWSQRPPSINSRCISFYADCPHKVEVKEGKRATLAFKVYTKNVAAEKKVVTAEKKEGGGGGGGNAAASPSSSSAPSGAILPASARVPALLKRELRELFGFVLAKTKAVGIILDHAYNLHATELKGIDAKMYEFLQQVPDVDLQIIPVVVRDNFYGSYGECDAPESVSVVVYPLTDADLAHAVDEAKTGLSDSFPHLDNIPFFFHNVGYKGTKGKKITASHVPYASYTGNESQPESAESVYLYRAVLVTSTATDTSSGEEEDEENE